MRTGVLGGSFDPVHVGHLAVAEACLRAAGLDTVLFMVAGAPPHKLDRTLAPAADRLEMTRLAVRDRPAFRADDRELSRRGPSFTVDTVRELLGESGGPDEVFWIIGGDTLPDLPPESVSSVTGAWSTEPRHTAQVRRLPEGRKERQ